MSAPYLEDSLQANCRQSLSQSIPRELLDFLDEPLEDFGSNLDYLYDIPQDNNEVYAQEFPELPPADGFEEFIDPALQNDESSNLPTLQGQSGYTYPAYGTKPLLFQSPDGRFMTIQSQSQSTPPSQVQPELAALHQTPNPYAHLYPHYPPQSQYPDAGINGHQGALSIPQYPPVYDQKPAPGICMNCGCVAHYPPCFRPHSQAKPVQSLTAQISQPEQRKWAPKSRWMEENEESDECPEPAKKGRKNVSRLVSRAAKSKTTRAKRVQKGVSTDIFPYPFFQEFLDWTTADGCNISYLSAGQFDDELLLTAKELRDYLEQCPRELRIWLQNSPSKCKGRHIDADVKCRYSECPAKYGTILHGWHRVAFDEFPERTSTGIKDPYKMAGVMHLWCFEQCIDPLEPVEKKILLPDDREFEHETSNRMAITRDDYKDVIEGAIKPWARERRKVGVIQAPYAKHEDTLAWALCNFHVKHQNVSRGRTRQKRNEDKPDDEKKSMDLIMGNLAEYHKRLELARHRRAYKGGNERSNGFASGSANPPQVGRQSPERKEIAEHVPEDRVQDVIEAAPFELPPYSEDEMFEFLKQFNETNDAAPRPLTPQSLGTEVPMRVSCSPPTKTAVMSVHPLASQAKVSPGVIQDCITIPGPIAVQANDSPLGMRSLFGSPTGSVSSTGSRKRSRDGKEVGTPEAKKRRPSPPNIIALQAEDSPLGMESLFGSPIESVSSSTRSRKRSREEEIGTPEAKRRPPPTWKTGPPRKRSGYSLPSRSPIKRGSVSARRKRISV
ncbi:hypothetical protein FPOA_09586 [Fusarium poae]|uniref:Uncharacterized protein n=1 Tax=Fusarium poae TaxID=36050 RepID=A0A1B8ABK5_FUSPO|nr:hypothetical protein FPOA_09586 [Fusarium poae]